MLFLKGWLNFLYLLCEEFYFALEELLRVFHILFNIIACPHIHQDTINII
uniref:Uncharacterized protein n=1 Tax=Anguilla anguilla TaxID=7936 RepID=A0A0E9TZY6_ANGAN